MPHKHHGGAHSAALDTYTNVLKSIVMGLHWDPPRDGSDSPPADLDALCVLYDAQDRVQEVIHPGRTRGAGGTVIHTGDSKTGASAWDDERIFVFLQALPVHVTQVVFVVASTSGLPFDAVHGATCHLSDHDNDRELLRVDLTTLAGRCSHTAAIVRRGPAGWRLNREQAADVERLRAFS